MKKKILIVASSYYNDLTSNLILSAQRKLKKKNIIFKVIKVPGTFEIPILISKNIKKYHAFIALGCVIKGETPHFDFICNSTFNALMNISVSFKKPVGNGIITCLNMSQAKKRSKTKGNEAVDAVLDILNYD
tara:strand:+ start:633 stop:1028 length:396 start_codon:yes stop_codon:yes gene_type:complete